MKIFVDFSILVEHVKGAQIDFIPYCTAQSLPLYIDTTVVSEFLLQVLAIRGNKSPLTLKRKELIASSLDYTNTNRFLKQFSVLSNGAEVAAEAPTLMAKHNLLPNDAIILATCIHHAIPYLASYDTNDFATACQAEGVTLLDDVAAAQQHLTRP